MTKQITFEKRSVCILQQLYPSRTHFGRNYRFQGKNVEKQKKGRKKYFLRKKLALYKKSQYQVFGKNEKKQEKSKTCRCSYLSENNETMSIYLNIQRFTLIIILEKVETLTFLT